jgi:hypothetical protein
MDRETADEISRRLDVFGERLLDAFGERLGAEIRFVREELGAEIQTNRRRADVLGEDLGSQIRLVAEGLQGFREETALEFKAVLEEIAETRIMIRLSFNDLDRRIRS